MAILISHGTARADVLKIGSISDEPTNEISKFLPLAQYLEDVLSAHSIDRVKIVVAASMSEMAAMMSEGRVDVYVDSPFPAIVVSRLSGGEFLLRRWKKGVGEYHAVIFARKDSGLESLDDLRGKTIAFEEPFSSSGYMLPYFSLKMAGYSLRETQVSVPVGPNEIGYLFTNEDENTIVWVLQGRVAAGAIDNSKLLPLANRSADQLHILHSTMTVPRQVVLVRPDLPAVTRNYLKQTLMSMPDDARGRAALRAFENTAKFDPIPASFWETLPELTAFVDELLGTAPTSSE